MEKDIHQRIQEANKRAFDIFVQGQPVWVGVKPAIEAIPGMKKNLLLHTGPPIEIDRMVPAQRDGVIGGILFEGLAKTRQEALEMVRRGEIELAPGLDYGVPGGGMAPTTASMPIQVARDLAHGTESYTTIQEGPSSEALRWGIYNEVVEERWAWFKGVLGPALDTALRETGGVNLRNVIARSLHMGDENHSRELGSTLLIFAELTPHLAQLDLEKAELVRCLDFLIKAERFALHVLMAGCNAVLQAAKGIDYCTVVTGMGGNGIEVGIKVSSLGEEWFTAPAPLIQGNYLNPSWTIEDTVPFSGDSCVVEAMGLGGLAAAASPAVTLLTGSTVQEAISRTRLMREITIGMNPNYQIPILNFEGTPTCIDIIKVLEKGIEPQSHAGIIHKRGGQAGAGVASIPMECFRKAFLSFAQKYALEEL
ncbi:MAG: DUF1116 domain-containing protein [Chloroflexi bacterium]|nr:DUF1116 domain-containing protein [Chloroflexota bacterium]